VFFSAIPVVGYACYFTITTVFWGIALMYVKLQMLGVLRNSPDSMSMSSLRDYIDPNMMDLYPHDCVFKVSSHFHIVFPHPPWFGCFQYLGSINLEN